MPSSSSSSTTTTRSYWAGAIIDYPGNDLDPAHMSDVKRLAQTLLEGNIRSAQLEKLYGSGAWCVRANKANRILFTTVSIEGQAYLLFLEYIDKHAYDKASMQTRNDVSKRKQQLLAAHYEDPNQVTIMARDQTPVVQAEPVDVMTQYREQYILLDATQENVLGQSLPLIVNGAAGSGKSCLAFKRLVDYAQAHHNDSDTLLYITRSARLAEDMQTMWDGSLELPGNYKGKVEFVDYGSYVGARFPQQVNGKELVGKEAFIAWAKKKKVRVGIDVATLYQECQHMAACANEGAYLQLGRKTSLIHNEDKKKIAYACFQQYRDYLNGSNKVDLRFLELEDVDPEYHLVMVDEAQDFSPCELDVLRRLAYVDQVAFFMDTNQSLLESVSIRPYLERVLTENSTLKLTQLELKTTYRCAPEVLAFANAVLKLKNAVLGGRADKFEYTSATYAASDDRHGSVKWVDAKNKKAIAALADLSQDPNTAVIVADERMRREARDRFKTPLVFTIAEIKGLEFKNIILYKMLQQDAFVDIDRKVPDDVDGKAIKKHLPKQQENLVYNTAFAKVFTAATRAIENCYVVEHDDHKRRNTQTYLRSKATVAEETQAVEKEDTATTRAEYNALAQKLIREGNLQQARGVMQEWLGVDCSGVADLTPSALLNLLNPNKVKAVSSSSVAITKNSSNGKAPKGDGVSEAGEKLNKNEAKKTVSTVESKKDKYVSYVESLIRSINKTNIENLLNSGKFNKIMQTVIPAKGMTLSRYLTHHCGYMLNSPALFRTLCMHDNGRGIVNAILLEKIKDDGSFNLSLASLAYVHGDLIPHQFDQMNVPASLETPSTLSIMARETVLYPALIHAFSAHIKRQTFNARRNRSAFHAALLIFSKGHPIYGAESTTNPLYDLASTQIGAKFICRILNERPDIFTIDDVYDDFAGFRLKETQANHNQFTNVLDRLAGTNQGRLTIMMLFIRFPILFRKITEHDLINMDACAHNPSYVPLLIKLASHTDSLPFVVDIFKKRPDLYRKFTAKQVGYSAIDAKTGELRAGNLMYVFAESAAGQGLLQNLLEHNPGIAREIEGKALTRRFMGEDAGVLLGSSAFCSLCKSDVGMGILNDLFTTQPALAQHITGEIAGYPLSNDDVGNKDMCPLLYMTGTQAGIRLFRTLLRLNPGLAGELTYVDCTRPVGVNSDNTHTGSALGNLFIVDGGLEILSDIIDKNPRIASSLTAEFFTRTLSGTVSSGEAVRLNMLHKAGISPESVSVFKKLFDANPNIFFDLKLQDLLGGCEPSKPENLLSCSPLTGFMRHDAGVDFLNHMLATAEKLGHMRAQVALSTAFGIMNQVFVRKKATQSSRASASSATLYGQRTAHSSSSVVCDDANRLKK